MDAVDLKGRLSLSGDLLRPSKCRSFESGGVEKRGFVLAFRKWPRSAGQSFQTPCLHNGEGEKQLQRSPGAGGAKKWGPNALLGSN
jgi:hypothetical protein